MSCLACLMLYMPIQGAHLCTYPEILPCLQGKEPKNFSASNYDADSICAMTSLAMLIEKMLSEPPLPPGV